MTKIIYEVDGLIIDVYYSKTDNQIRWSIQSSNDKSPTFNVDQIKTIIDALDKSLDFNWEVK